MLTIDHMNNIRFYKGPGVKIIDISRRGVYGNPYRVTRACSREQSIMKYRPYFSDRMINDFKFRKAVNNIRRYKKCVLLCYCKPRDCHGDIIIEYLKCETDWAKNLNKMCG